MPPCSKSNNSTKTHSITTLPYTDKFNYAVIFKPISIVFLFLPKTWGWSKCLLIQQQPQTFTQWQATSSGVSWWITQRKTGHSMFLRGCITRLRSYFDESLSWIPVISQIMSGRMCDIILFFLLLFCLHICIGCKTWELDVLHRNLTPWHITLPV